MVGLIKKYNIDARYTMMSATGQAVDPGLGGNLNIMPRRVLDAFFWALEFQSR
jgi:hypothetical protein